MPRLVESMSNRTESDLSSEANKNCNDYLSKKICDLEEQLEYLVINKISHYNLIIIYNDAYVFCAKSDSVLSNTVSLAF